MNSSLNPYIFIKICFYRILKTTTRTNLKSLIFKKNSGSKINKKKNLDYLIELLHK